MMIREGNIHDALGIASVHVKSWQTTYRGIISDKYLSSLNISERAKRWEEILSDPDQKVFVALDGEDIVGFATCGKSEELAGFYSTLSSIYLLSEYQGNGTGKELFGKCRKYLKSLGYPSMYIWVLADNPAKNFYEKIGGRFLKEQEVLIGEDTYIEYAYAWII